MGGWTPLDASKRPHSRSQPALCCLPELGHDLFALDPYADRREAQHGLVADDDVVQPEHVLPPCQRLEMDGAVDLDAEGAEICIEVAAPSLAIQANRLPDRP